MKIQIAFTSLKLPQDVNWELKETSLTYRQLHFPNIFRNNWTLNQKAYQINFRNDCNWM